MRTKTNVYIYVSVLHTSNTFKVTSPFAFLYAVRLFAGMIMGSHDTDLGVEFLITPFTYEQITHVISDLACDRVRIKLELMCLLAI